MKTLSLTLLAATVSTLLIVPAQAEDNVSTTQSAFEYSYQHELNQGDLSGDRILQRDRVQDRLRTSTEDGSKIQDQLNRQDRVRSELKTNSEARNSVQMMNTNRMQNSFSHSVGAGKAGGGSRR